MTDIVEFITSLPKAELHVHIEGTIEADLLFAMADRNGIRLPYKTADDVLLGYDKNTADTSFDSFIESLDISRGVLRTGQDYEDIAYGYLKSCQSENIIHAEIMFDPQQGMRQGVSLEALLEGLLSGGQAGTRDFGVSVQWIMSFQRNYPVEQALSVLKAARPYRDRIAGIGLDNQEPPDFPKTFAPLYAAARQDGYRLTSHCDVDMPNSTDHIRDCISILGVERIDHGLNAIEDDDLVQQLIDKEIPLTGCPTRYAFQAEVASDRVGNRLAMMIALLERGVRISVNSDDPAQFGSGWLTQTLIEAQRSGNLSRDTITKFVRNGFLSAWLPNDQKATYLERFERSCDEFEWED